MHSERNLMPERIPIKAAREVAKGYSCRQVIVLAWDGELTHIVTYGESTEDCAQAAAGGNMLKQKWGWPECNDQPSRVKKLEKELAAEREARERAEGALRRLRNEVHAALGLAEPEMREALGNTNVNCLSNRLREADELLAALKSSQSTKGKENEPEMSS